MSLFTPLYPESLRFPDHCQQNGYGCNNQEEMDNGSNAIHKETDDPSNDDNDSNQIQ